MCMRQQRIRDPRSGQTASFDPFPRVPCRLLDQLVGTREIVRGDVKRTQIGYGENIDLPAKLSEVTNHLMGDKQRERMQSSRDCSLWRLVESASESRRQNDNTSGAQIGGVENRRDEPLQRLRRQPRAVRATDILTHLDEEDRVYFRETREKRLGATLETVTADRETSVLAFRKTLEPIRTVLAAQPYVGGGAPAYADYAVFGCFQWARCTSSFPLLLKDDPVWARRDRLLFAFDGFAAKSLGYAV